MLRRRWGRGQGTGTKDWDWNGDKRLGWGYQHDQGVPAPQVGSAGQIGAQVDGNGSLVFRPLVKEQHGRWECTATNPVASVSTATSVHVLGEWWGRHRWVLNPGDGGGGRFGNAPGLWLSELPPSHAVSLLLWVPGTSPHAVTNVSVLPLLLAANISWEPGFDGGYFQRFSVWYTPL